MDKYFNITGLCVPGKHYMVDTSVKIETIINTYIRRGEYFTINRARQFGKTTTLNLLKLALEEDYVVLKLSFEGAEDLFASLESFVRVFSSHVIYALNGNGGETAQIWEEPIDDTAPLTSLRRNIINFCKASPRPVILLIDEVDRASNFEVFRSFLGLLRDMYLVRESDNIPTFQSVILAGVHDIKNLRKRIRPESEHTYNSPWNIAADFTVDLAFSAPEIATMLEAYEADHATSMDITALSEHLYYYTSGYPFLVSRLCKTIDETPLTWDIAGVDAAVKILLDSTNTLFDDLIKNVENYPDFAELLKSILVEGVQYAFNIHDPRIELGLTFGILARVNNHLGVSNIIFESVLYDYFLSLENIEALRKKQRSVIDEGGPQFIRDGHLDLDLVCERFKAFLYAEYRDEDSVFIERQARLLFLAYLKPIVNGTGHYVVEPETRGARRMDIVVHLGGEEYVIELKIWRGDAYEERGMEQLVGYLAAQGLSEGWLMSFCDLERSPREGGTWEVDGRTIHEVVVAYRDVSSR